MNTEVKNWCEKETTECRYRVLPPPYDNIYIGSDPRDGMTKEFADSFDAFINVNDAPGNHFYPSKIGQIMHWYPIQEMGYWGYAPFYWFKHVMEFHWNQKHKIYVHCAAGAYRSPTMVEYWLRSLGKTPMEAARIVARHEHLDDRWYRFHLEYPTIHSGNIPKEIAELYRRFNQNPRYSLGGLVYTENPIERTKEILGTSERVSSFLRRKRFKYYYEFKDWLWYKRKDIGLYLTGMVEIKEGICTKTRDNPNSIFRHLPKALKRIIRNFCKAY